MNITYKERQELNDLSQKAFGVSSKWKRILEDGYLETWTRDRQAMVAGTDGKMEKKTFTEKKYVTKYPTVEEIRKFMTEEIEKMEAAKVTSAKFDQQNLENNEPAQAPTDMLVGGDTTNLSGTDETPKVAVGNER